jgi:uncharacterized protein YjdB
MEALEARRLLANIIPSGVISSKSDGSNFDYMIALSNSSSSGASIGTFWYSWVPGEDFLATAPTSVTPPTGWIDNVTSMGSGDGFAIQFISNGASDNVQPGSSLNFVFTSADTPAELNGDSVFYPSTPVGTSFVYPQGPFSDAGHQFVVAQAATLTSIAVTPANTSLPAGETEQFTATGTLSNGTTENLTSQVTWASSDTTWATINSAGLATSVSPGPVTISATLGSISGSTGLTATAAALESIAVTPVNTSLPVGKTEQFTATGTLSNGTTENLTSSVTWASSDTTWATINSAGLATAVSAGPVTISATLGSISGTTSLTVINAATVSAISVSWGTAGTASLQTAADGLRLLPAGRATDLPWSEINRIAITLSSSATLTSADVTVSSAVGINYGPVTISGSGTNYVIMLAQPISTADRVTFTIGNSAIATYTRRLDVLPGDVNDDGVVNSTDGVLILRNETPAHAYNVIYDVNGDGDDNTLDFTMYRPNIGTVLPPVVAPAAMFALKPAIVDVVLGAIDQEDFSQPSSASNIASATVTGQSLAQKQSASLTKNG